MGDARRIFTQAQEIANENGYHYLAQTISREHDALLDQLDLWENFKKVNAPVSERMELALLSGSIEKLIETQEVRTPELIEEAPVLLTIMSKTGYMVFTNPFSVEIPFDEKRIGEFVSFFNSISDQMFSSKSA